MSLLLSILLVNSATLLGAAVTLGTIWWQGRTERYALSWALALLVALPGLPLLLGLSPHSGPVGIFLALLGSICRDAGLFFLADGMARYRGRRMHWRRWLFAGAVIVAISAISLIRGDQGLHRLLHSGFIQAAVISAAIDMLRPADGTRRWGLPTGAGEWLLLGGFGFLLFANAVHIVDLLFNSYPPRPLPDTETMKILLMAQPFIVMTIGMGGVITMSQRLMAEREAQRLAAEQAAEQARAADRAKSEFLATISHEIRTPINAIQGCLQILGAHGLNPSQARLAEVMGSSSANLLALIEDVLDMARMEAGRVTLDPGVTDLGALLREVMVLTTPKADHKGLMLSLRPAPGLPAAVLADGRRLRQILLNLVGNAVKFTEKGHVSLTVEPLVPPPGAAAASALENGQPPVWVRFEVTDTGIGVPADKLDSIFLSFSQGDNTLTRRFGGAGLGLSIAKQLAEMMGGSIGVESVPGQGSRFTVTLPLTVVQPGSQAEGGPRHIAPLLPHGPLGGPAVMLLEGDDVNRVVATELLVGRGADVVQAADGGEALALLAQRRIDIILIDLSTPALEGLETARHIRNLPLPAGNVPIVALNSGLITPEIRQLCRDIGIQAFLTKPIRVENLVSTLTALLPLQDKPAA
ncbi:MULTISPECIES: ATP-binding protein [unclassified Azospirillum]|uniref:ATP-binding protein n=1 Tax=unclassified Azospirillum TaxID=2630922 RepID=UPI000B67B290|nr:MULTISPECIES: ATP-binding protein [unclassified Azospirillum]SNS70412.1 Signal transduction histidine kinase [Azospirillum sp. RU38E]SNS88724.1 Signal transduction histidine kinase [Azospirillum sp. RU37A]